MQIENTTANRFKLSLPVQQNPMTQSLLAGIMKINELKLPAQEIFKIGDDGKPKFLPDAPEKDKIMCKPKGFSDQGYAED